MTRKSTIQIELTPAQQEQLKKSTGKDVPAVKLALEALEERLAPLPAYCGGGVN